MEMREEHSGLNFITRGGESPQGKPKAYFCATEKDQKKFFEEICADIFKYRPECAIFYKGEDDPGFTENRQEVLAEMQLFVRPATTELLTKENSALSLEYPFAQENKIPVLPLMQEQGLEDIFNSKCGELQFLDKNAKDDTAISYEDKLKKFLEAILIGDEMAEKIRAAFDAYIFLSYRKKDRKQAQDLMRLIHENEDFQDIAIWYDEFLVPGENFNQAIGDALQKCDVFTLLVTPNLINEPNYVQQHEYPAAVESRKPILPVEAQETDRAALEEQYPEIPHCTPEIPEQLNAGMLAQLQNITLGENNSNPMHLFFMGLAYLGGIDVERNPERAERLLTKSADLGLPEACEKLAQMYNTGEGVERNYETAALWLEKQAKLLKEIWEKEQTHNAGNRYFVCLRNLGDAWKGLGKLDKAQKAFKTMLALTEQRLQNHAEDWGLQSQYGLACSKLGDMAQTNGKLQEAEDWYRKYLEISKALAEETETPEDRRGLAVSYERMGYIAEANGKLREAESWYRKLLEISEKLAGETGTLKARELLLSAYQNMGNTALAFGEPQEAEVWYRKLLEISKALADETEDAGFKRNLGISYEKLGDLARACGKFREAESWYRKDLEISENLSEETETIQARRSLSVCYQNMGDIAKRNSKLHEAEDWYQKCLEVTKALEEETGTPDARRSLSVACERMGGIAEASGKLQEAESWYRKDLEISEALAEETGTPEARRSLAIAYGKMGSLAGTGGNFREAESWCRKNLEISKALEEEIGTIEYKRDLALAYYILGAIMRSRKKYLKAFSLNCKFGSLLTELVQETGDPESAQLLNDLIGSRKRTKFETDLYDRVFCRQDN